MAVYYIDEYIEYAKEKAKEAKMKNFNLGKVKKFDHFKNNYSH